MDRLCKVWIHALCSAIHGLRKSMLCAQHIHLNPTHPYIETTVVLSDIANYQHISSGYYICTVCIQVYVDPYIVDSILIKHDKYCMLL